MNVLKTST